MFYILPSFKIEHLKEVIDEIVQSNEKIVTARQLARVIGKIIASEKALGPIVRIMLRSTMVSLDYAVISRGWDTYVSLTETIKTDMKLGEFSMVSQPIRKFWLIGSSSILV